jgi:predicted nucleic acid-binding protein
MRGFLLDTNCISELVRPTPDPGVIEWMEAADEQKLFLSVLTIGEIRKGLTGLAAGKRRTRLEAWLVMDLQSRFDGRILPIEAGIADRWGAMSAEAKRRGKPLAIIDGLLAATAQQHKLTVVTRNTSDFAITQVSLINPWK